MAAALSVSERTAASGYRARLPAADLAEADPTRCLHCGELLAWPAPADCRPAPAVSSRSIGSSFAYDLGHRVQPTPTLTAPISWRSQFRERHPSTGLVHRVNYS